VFLMVFQGSLLFGFIRAASRVIQSTDSDLWITARGVLCFDFAAPLPRRFLEISRGTTGVEHATRVVVGPAEYRTPEGHHYSVALIGAEPAAGQGFPLPYREPGIDVLEPDAVVVDESSAESLDLRGVPADVEINGRRTRVLRLVSGFSSFLGSPFVFTTYSEASRYLRLSQEESMYILLQVKRGEPLDSVKQELHERLPEVDVLTKAEFSRRSQWYWLSRTGAGAAIMTAAILAFLIGLVIVSQTIYATTMDNIEEYATLKALGASRWFVMRVVLMQALACAIAGCVLGLIVAFPVIGAVQNQIAWVYTPVWLPPAMLLASGIMCCLAAIVSIRKALAVEPARVFRA
jgi:putative ABC transport system permease protein